MSEARICDRCGACFKPKTKYVTRFAVQEVTDNGFTHNPKAYGDVCPKCAEKAVKWWNKRRNEGR